MSFKAALDNLLEQQDLNDSEAEAAMNDILKGNVNGSQIAAFLTSLKTKPETVLEIAGFARAMRSNSTKVSFKSEHLTDTAGTGGDGKGTFNVSTCAAIVAAGSGVIVAKHGNRAYSGKSGSADVLEELGVRIDLTAEEAMSQLNTAGITFLFAPMFHPAMKNVALVRKELGFRTVFNILGPLTNPAGAERQLLGVYNRKLLPKMAEAMRLLGIKKGLVVGSDTDEISISSETEIYEVSGREISRQIVRPEDFGFRSVPIDLIRAGSATESAEIILSVLKGKQGPSRDIVLLNAGAAISVSGIAGSLHEGLELARKSIDTGRAMDKLKLLRDFNGHT